MVFNYPLVKHSCELPLRRKIYSVLGAVNAFVFNGNAPAGTSFPYVVIGESVTGAEFVTKGSEGEELIVTLHIYTKEEGFDRLDELTEETVVALSSMPEYLDDHWSITKYQIDSGSRKWHYAQDKTQKIIYVRFSCNYE